ncbi:DUF4179 domain-containing protein [Clostridium ljungdahlii]|uniref:DUF4179 domain-containing protein n=1 Tax=Clostridium ljungdahlii TaxID=1538 RepID=A0A168NEN6_9CLOT|nr:DUF4179 domain-containing protein [Clostridium ljungdahlii]OAA86330.1 hypothetical protein WY13_02446 [Clostridium ljungdahlii]
MNDFNMEEKDVYKLFNDVRIEESEFDPMDEEVTDIEKQKIKKNLKKKIRGQRKFKTLKYASIAAALGLICTIGIGTISPAFAENIPILNSITQKLNDEFGSHGSYAEYSEIINKPVTSNGVTLTINEIIADDSKLVIGYTIKSNKHIENLETFGLSMFLKIDGKRSGSNGSSVGNYTNDCTYVGSEEIHTDLLKNTSNKVNITLNVDEISNIKGEWDFAFSASKDQLVKNSVVFKPNIKLDFPNSIAKVDKVVFSPIDTSIFISGNYKDKEKVKKNMEVNHDDSLMDYDYWAVYDDKGVELMTKGSGGSSDTNKGIFNVEMQYNKLNKIPKYLTIVPCKITPSAVGGEGVDKNGKEVHYTIKSKKPVEISKTIDGVYPIELSQGKMGKIVIESIETNKDSTTVKYRVEGKAPYFQAQDLWIKDSSGKGVDYKSYDIRKDDSKPNEFVRQFKKLDSNKKYTIFTNDFSNVDFREDLKFTINLSK